MSSPTEGLMEIMSAKIKTFTAGMSAETMDTVIGIGAVVSVLLAVTLMFWILTKVAALLVRAVLGGGGAEVTKKKKSSAPGQTPIVAEVAGNAWMNAAGITHPDKA